MKHIHQLSVKMPPKGVVLHRPITKNAPSKMNEGTQNLSTTKIANLTPQCKSLHLTRNQLSTSDVPTTKSTTDTSRKLFPLSSKHMTVVDHFTFPPMTTSQASLSTNQQESSPGAVQTMTATIHHQVTHVLLGVLQLISRHLQLLQILMTCHHHQ